MREHTRWAEDDYAPIAALVCCRSMESLTMPSRLALSFSSCDGRRGDPPVCVNMGIMLQKYSELEQGDHT